MSGVERRKNPRVQIYDPITFLGLGPDGRKLQRNVAVVRNVSKTGIRIETSQAVSAERVALMFYDLNQNPIEIKGDVIYCDRNDTGHYNVGIDLAGTPFENRLFVRALVKSYHYLKNKSELVISPGILN